MCLTIVLSYGLHRIASALKLYESFEKLVIAERRQNFEDEIFSAKGGQKSMSIINSTEYSIIRRNIRCVITENLNAKSTSVTAL